MNTQEEFDDFKKDAPKLSSMDKRNPFVVPEQYFETLSSRIQDQIASENKHPQWITFLKSLLLPKVAIPAIACCLLLGVGLKFLKKPEVTNTNSKGTLTFDELSETDFVNYIDEEQIIIEIEQQKSVTTNNSEIEDYLIENNIDESELIKALN